MDEEEATRNETFSLHFPVRKEPYMLITSTCQFHSILCGERCAGTETCGHKRCVGSNMYGHTSTHELQGSSLYLRMSLSGPRLPPALSSSESQADFVKAYIWRLPVQRRRKLGESRYKSCDLHAVLRKLHLHSVEYRIKCRVRPL